MEKNDRLLPLPTATDLQPVNHDYPGSYSPMNDDDSFENKRSIREQFNVVYKRLPIIIAMTILTTAVVAFYMYKQPSVYQAQTAMIIEPRKPKVQSKEAININFGNDANYYATQLLLLKNSELMRDVVVRLNLQSEPNLLGGQSKSVLATFRSIFSSNKDSAGKETSLPVLTETTDEITSVEQVPLTPEEKERVDRYAAILLNGLTVEQVERTNLVNITVQSISADFAAKAANKVAEVFIEQDSNRETQGAKKNLEDLGESIDKLRTTIAQQDVERLNYLRSTGLPVVDGEGMRKDRVQTISGQWLAAIDERRKIEAKYDAVMRANAKGEGTSIPDVTESAVVKNMLEQNNARISKLQEQIQAIDTNIQTAEAKLSQLRARYEDAYVENQSALQQIAKLQQLRDKLQNDLPKIEIQNKSSEKLAVSGALTGLKSTLESAQRREGELQRAYQNELASSNAQGQAETRLTTLTREIETNRQLLDTYTQRQKEQELAVTSTKPDNLKITSPAQKPVVPFGPNRGRNTFVAFLLSLAAGIGLAFLLDYLDDSIKSTDDIGRQLGLPTLSSIPYQSASEKRKLSLSSNNGNGNGSLALIALEDNRSPVAEAYRHLRTSLLFSSAGKPPQTILITSSQPAEGKTTTAINTAITLAQSGADVVIVDCDLRRPRLHNHFNLENSTGLTNYLSGDKNTENLLKPFPNMPGLKIITSGPIPPNPAELLSSNEMKNLLQFLKGNFQHVVIDSPPAISFTDAAILSTLVDGVVLVAMAGKSSVHLMRRFKQRLSHMGARIYGVVLNGIKENSSEYGYYGYGSTYNYYDQGIDDSTPLMEDVVSAHETKK